MPRFVVTGCAGFIGSHLCERLLADGCEVAGIDRFAPGYPSAVKERSIQACREHDRFSLERLDLAAEDLRHVLDGADGVFHLAARPGVRGSWGEGFDRYLHDNLHASQRVFEASAAAGVRAVLASSSSVYGAPRALPIDEGAPTTPISPYGVTKLAAETLAAAYAESMGLDVVTVRLFTVYGPRQRPDMAIAQAIAAIAESRPFDILGDGRQTRDLTFVDDAVAALVAAMRRAPTAGIFNVGGGCEVVVRDLIELLGEIAGRRIEVRHQPPVAGEAVRTLADTARAREQLGWTPRVGLRNGLATQLEAGTGASPVLVPARA